MKIHFDLSCHFRITDQMRGMNNHAGDWDLSTEVFYVFNKSGIIRWIYSLNYRMWNPITLSHISQCPEDHFDQGRITHFWGP